MRGIRPWLLVITLLFSLPALLLYLSLAVKAKRLLTLSEWGRFAGIILFAEIAHLNENGGPRAWAIAGESLSNAALTEVSLKANPQTYQIPLPPNTIRKSCNRLIAGLPQGFKEESPGSTIPKSCLSGAKFPTEYQSFITAASPNEVNRYTSITLPAAGWTFTDRFGSAWVFQKNETRLMIDLGSYLTVFIADFSVDLSSVPRKAHKRFDLKNKR